METKEATFFAIYNGSCAATAVPVSSFAFVTREAAERAMADRNAPGDRIRAVRADVLRDHVATVLGMRLDVVGDA